MEAERVPEKDLIVLVADKDMQVAIQSLLRREKSLESRGIGGIRGDVFVHSEHDPSCCGKAQDFLRPFLKAYSHALVIFDFEGSGQEKKHTASELTHDLEARLRSNGWNDDRAAVVVIEPELEAWVWSSSPEVAKRLGWKVERGDLRVWLQSEEFWPADTAKPPRPKEAVEHVLKTVKRAKSSDIYGKIAERVSLRGCQDNSFQRFISILQRWFPL